MYDNMYSEIYESFSKLLIYQQPQIIFISKKWNDCDLVWPFSDLDFRIITYDENIDFFEMNENIYIIQKKLILKDKKLKRILEHPPGYIFKFDELKKNHFEDINNWSFCYGKYDKFFELKSKYNDVNVTEYYYINIIKKRYKKFSLKYDYKDFCDNLAKKYDLYCTLWHYYFPCEYAINSLNKFKAQKNKIETLNLENSLLRELYIDITKNTKNYEEKYNILSVIKEIDRVLEKKLSQNSIDLFKKYDNIDRYFEAITMLRTRVSRYLLYLDTELEYNRDYLINREINELKFIFSEIYSKNNTKIIENIYNYVTSDNKPNDILKYTLTYLNEYRNYFNNLMNFIGEE